MGYFHFELTNVFIVLEDDRKKKDLEIKVFFL